MTQLSKKMYLLTFRPRHVQAAFGNPRLFWLLLRGAMLALLALSPLATEPLAIVGLATEANGFSRSLAREDDKHKK